MFVECVVECRVPHDGRIYLFEEKASFGYVYKVDEDLCKAACATGNCVEVKDYKGPSEIPSSMPMEVTAVEAPAPEPAAPAEEPTAPARPKASGKKIPGG